MSFSSVLLFFAGIYYTQLTGGSSGPIGVVIKVIFLVTGIGLWLGSVTMWVWFCSRNREGKAVDEGGEGTNTFPGALGGGDGALWSSDSSERVWGGRMN